MKPLLSGYVATKPDGGPECESLERDLEAHYDMPHARVLNSATSALHAALVALGIGPGDDVLVPSYSMSASAAAVVHAGATPIFCDIGDDYCLDWDDALARITVRTRAAVLVHLFGHHATVPGAVTLPILHDAAQSPSLQPRLRPGRRDIWVYSLNQNKLVSCGEGGYALCFERKDADTIHAVRNHGENTGTTLGWNYRMTEPIARIARAEFSDIAAKLVDRRMWAYAMRRKHDLPEDCGNQDWFVYPVRVHPDRRGEYAARIGGRVGYQPPIYRMPYFRALYPHVSRPNVERIESEMVILNPMDAAA